jgi:hypothetical protein
VEKHHFDDRFQDLAQLGRPARETRHFEKQNASNATQLNTDAFMASISANERASSDSLQLREEEPVPASSLALLSSVATSRGKYKHTVASHGQNGVTFSVDWREFFRIPNEAGLQILQPENSRTFSLGSRHDAPAAPPPEDEEMEDTLDRSEESASNTSNMETIPKLRKHPAKFECSLHGCKKRFTRRVNLEAHIRAHSNTVPTYICTECDRRFTRIEDHRRHVKERHIGTKKQHVCGIVGKPGPEGCGQSFTRAEALRRHLRSKAGSKCGRPANDDVCEETPSHVLGHIYG